MFGWLNRWQERRITRAWLRESAGDREILEQHFNYAADGNGTVIMTPKAGSDEASAQ